MDKYKEDYERLKEEFETYQRLAEKNIETLTEKNILYERNLDAMYNIIEISKYINSYLGDENLIPMINDMIIGILGVTYSTIYIMEENELEVKATNKSLIYCYNFNDEKFKMFDKNEPFIINSETPTNENETKSSEIHSLVGVPIRLRDKFIGNIIIEHTLWNFFNSEHIKFISSIANQIAIALENNFLYNKVRESAIKDPLMGIYNRRYFFDKVSSLIKEDPSKRFAVVMMDMDNFKKANDPYGHQFGDEVLKNTAKLLKENINEKDVLARYGGEEIVIYFYEIENFKDIFSKVDDIREKISKNVISYGEYSKTMSASFGLSFYPEDGGSIENILSKADAMLYKAKEGGRNKVVSSK